MPIEIPKYLPPLPLKSGHLSTIYCGLFRSVAPPAYQRERLELDDGDFLDLDWAYGQDTEDSVVILLHGLEGDSQRPYMRGSVRTLSLAGYDVCAVNFRGCSGEPNRLFRSYHSGATEDLDAVVQHILAGNSYRNIFIKGFSMGGNLAFKYAGEGRALPAELKGIVGISVPCNLHDALLQLESPSNFLYTLRFLRHLKLKLKQKQAEFPNRITPALLQQIRSLKDFDDHYTSRAHGFADALDYYHQSSCLQFIPGIEVPALMINAENDSFLGSQCYPRKEAARMQNFLLETPRYGGHVGFYGPSNTSYTESRSLKFLDSLK